MKTALQPDTIYHIFQRGNNRENIFFEEVNYKLTHQQAPNLNSIAHLLEE